MTGPHIHREVLRNPNALSLPTGAVRSSGSAHRVTMVDPATGKAGEREVEIGPAKQYSTKNRAGLEAGETILVPKG